ncbi:cellulase family glycosylhydrolase [Capnocytophaga catalasegens]|uniref:Glycoside hydrolase family 5 domain-containing protein n=1 Tax=Capnocytophaga catalasegens TaxID=1004260 RepID=A0AAV5AW45_9FLAO|nr:cellulase family glycosylhydrolase [Capnocytophaga catalasegens]GIZ15684.1 hypothetical protein RCZ03_16840 [Capnocytophaga catalasegens]GJM50071.1 hypothetical protein RCZ15_10450 [Capnocytophaga catalasegens]GJM53104.1 hypothetical protein RCZ16_14210 [Capnocytophaga catalasegens]
MRIIVIFFTIFLVSCKTHIEVDNKIKVSHKYPLYFERAGQVWIPISTNYLPEGNMQQVEEYFKRFSENGGNSMRIWISTEFLEIEDTTAGNYSEEKFSRISQLLKYAEKYGIYIKFTLQHIRTISKTIHPNENWANSQALSSQFKNIDEYVNTIRGKNSYLKRAKALSDRYKDHKYIYGWELWNEMDAVVDDPSWKNFTPIIIDSLKHIFPDKLITQSLGSMHAPYMEEHYLSLSKIAQNDFLSIHRYLDQGNKWGQYDIVKGPIDLLISDAIEKGLLLTKSNMKPVIINEIGAVEPNHLGAFNLYKKDTKGVLLHDFIFTPFFCGSAGSGNTWHWNHYIEPMNLWFHFQRFKTAIEGFDPIKERCRPFRFEHDNVRCYGLKGKNKTIIWCRDATNNWKTELQDEIPAQTKTNFTFSLTDLVNVKYNHYNLYNPWTDQWTNNLPIKNGKIVVPNFLRSIIVVLEN